MTVNIGESFYNAVVYDPREKYVDVTMLHFSAKFVPMQMLSVAHARRNSGFLVVAKLVAKVNAHL